MPDWRLMVEIMFHSKADSYTSSINNRALKFPFVGIANV